jgi:putative transposase
MLQPLRLRTWAPRGQTPILRAWDRRDRLSTIGALTISPRRRRLSLYFRWQRGNVDAEDLVAFVRQLHRHLGTPITLVWDRSGPHRKAARLLLARRPRWLRIEWLPAYAPELNPAEQIWNSSKRVDLANQPADDLEQLTTAVRASFARQRQSPSLLRAYFKHAQLKI